MEFLLDNPFAAMEGTSFLVLYSFVILASIATLAYFKHTLDESDKLGTPTIPPEIDPFETAYLRGGMNELARTVVFAVRQKGFITIEKLSKTVYLFPAKEKPEIRLSEIERRALDWIGPGREVKEVFTAPSALIDALAVYASAYRGELEKRQLLISNETRSTLRSRKWFTAAFIAALGSYKVLVGLLTGNFNILFTIGFAVLGVVGVILVGRERRRTKLGELYLERLRTVFQPLRSDIAMNRPVAESAAGFTRVDPLLLSVGIFGGVALAGTAFYDHNEAFEKAQRESNANASGTGCGGAACGGSSCSTGGGSSCASGCGGCSGGGGCGGGGCGGS